MATLVLSTVGTMLGGPLGGAVGSLLGQTIDQQLFGPGPRSGPRLGDLSVQTSSYGTAIPRIYGTMRVAGAIVWSTDLKEASQAEGAKGQPETVTYSYSASFAVAVSSRPIEGIGRIWADGKLIRTADGEFTVTTGFRVCSGTEDQPIDPLVATIEGMDSTPAYRGLALAIFEDMQLAEFGNRIPFLTFEVLGDIGEIAIKSVLADTSSGVIESSSTSQIGGYAAHGSTTAAAVEPLVDIFGMALFDDGAQLASPSTEVVDISAADLGCSAGPREVSRKELSQDPARTLPGALSLGYYEPARDYQAGVAQASVDVRQRTFERIELPAALQAAAAKALSETALGRRWAERDRMTLHLPPAYLSIKPGTLMRPPEESSLWRAEAITVDGLAVKVELRPLFSTIDAVPADPGRALPSEGVVPTATSVAVAELPDDGSAQGDAPVVVVAAANSSTIWRPVPLDVEAGGAVSKSRTAAMPSVMGIALTALGAGQAAAFDGLNSVDVELETAEGWLESRDDHALASGDNLALLGSELVQFGNVTPLGERRFRLNRLLRGRRGSEWAMTRHSAGERFVILDPARLRRLPLTSNHVGADVQVRPTGLADGVAVPVQATITGEAMRPPCPVHLRARFGTDGTLHCSWVRRSRLGWAWLDGVEVPLGCSVEQYRVRVTGPTGALEVETTDPDVQFAPAQIAAIGIGKAQISVVQVGDLAPSREATLSITLS